MLTALLNTGIQLTQIIGLGSLLLGALRVLMGLMGGRGAQDLLIGAALMAFGVYLAGLGQGF